MIICPSCGAQNEPANRFCDQCGTRLASATPAAPAPTPMSVSHDQPTAFAPSCPVCGANVLPGERFCDNCGADLLATPVAPPPTPQQAPPPAPPSAPQLFCPDCGDPVLPGERFCDNCGTDLSRLFAPPPAAVAPTTVIAPPPPAAVAPTTVIAPPPVSADAPTILAPPPAMVEEAATTSQPSPIATPSPVAPPPPPVAGPVAPPPPPVAEPVAPPPPPVAEPVAPPPPPVAGPVAPPPPPVVEPVAPPPSPVAGPVAPPPPPMVEPVAPPPPVAPAAGAGANLVAERARLEALLTAHRDTVAMYEQMAARYPAGSVPAFIIAGLDAARAELAKTEAELAALAAGPDPAEVARLEALIAAHRDTVAQYEQMAARYPAGSVPAFITAGLDAARAELAKTEAELAALTGKAPAPVVPPAPAAAHPAAPTPVATPAPPPPPATARLVLADGSEIMLPPGKHEYIIGREDPVSNIFPEIDLTPHGGEAGGVSRQHAKIVHTGNQWSIIDLNSTNHTRVNGTRIEPQTPTPLTDGAKLQFGRLVATFRIG